MYAIYLVFTLIFMWFCISGGTLLAARYCPFIPLARSLAVVFFALALFFVEHFIGLGNLRWLMPILMLASGWIFWRNKTAVFRREFIVAELVFAAAFIYAFAWRFGFPSITPSSERMTDLFFITNYMEGVTLPPLDNWHPPYRFDYYYAFQHYGAALMGRIFGFGPGVTYNIAFALLAGLALTLLVFIGERALANFSGRIWQKRALLGLFVATVAFGGTGISPLLKVAYNGPAKDTYVKPNMDAEARSRAVRRYHAQLANHAREHIIASVRFIGSERDTTLNPTSKDVSALGPWVFPETGGGVGGKKMVLPSENFGYQFFLGDYHPTVGGFFLLLLALALIFSTLSFANGTPASVVSASNADARNIGESVAIDSPRWQKAAQGLATLCVPLMLVTNTWTMPLLVILILGWMIFLWTQKQTLYWIWLLAGGTVGCFLLYPFLTTFLSSSLPTPVKFVQTYAHTPWPRFLALHWPLLILIVLGCWEGRQRRIAWYFSALWLFLLVLSEVIYIDDPTGAHYARTNTVMKWWGWMQVGVFASLGVLLLASLTRWVRWCCVAVMVLLSASAGSDLFNYYVFSGKYYAGQIHGHGWYTNNATNRQMFEYLEAAPDGIILENVLDNAYSNTSIYGIFNGKPVLLGWPSHLRTWHGDVPRIWLLKEEIDKFYKGELEDSLAWLQSNQVRYIVFSPKDDDKAFEKINERVKGHYDWHEYEHSRRRHTGIWVRLD